MSDHDTTDLLAANRAYADAFDGADTAKVPARQLFVLTCMDARVDPLRLLGLNLGDAHIVRNAGGRVSGDVVRSLVVSSALLGTRRVVVIQHTDCGMGDTTDDQVRAELAERGVAAEDLWTGAFGDLDESVRTDVAALRNQSLLPEAITVEGYVYDVATGSLRAVDPA